jgi:hypothetical protein
MWLIQKVLRKRAGTPGEEKEAIAQEKDGIPSEANQSNGNARSHLVFGGAEIGAAWSKESNEGGRTSPSSSAIRASPLHLRRSVR